MVTTVVIGRDGKQQIISAGLDPEATQRIQAMLADAEQTRQEETPCIGFHCYLKPKEPRDEAS